jgi:uncharacterized membrane protein YqjE
MNPQEPKKQNDNKFLIFMGIGFQMIATIGISGWIGRLIDDHYTNQQPIATLAMLLIGTLGSLWQLIRQVTKLNE